MPKKPSRHSDAPLAKPDDPIFKEGLTVFTPGSARPKPKRGKFTWKGLAKLGETGQSGGAIITGANLRRYDRSR